MSKYNPSKIEPKWQKFWQSKKQFFAKDFSKKPKKYILVEFPYPSGAGLHMGHLRPYVAGDIYARYHRMRGYEVVFPIGWDAFGLPAENYAIKMGAHPSKTVAQNIKNAKQQMLSWGLSFDFSREINTTDPSYYKWTQWIFLQFLKKGLAYEATGLINWCPSCKTGLANEEVEGGVCERCGAKVEKKELKQWYLKITAYAEKFLEGLKILDKWPQAVKLQQENWIGKSVGAEIEFPIARLNIKRFVLLHGKGGSSARSFLPWLRKHLETAGYEVQVPDMPNSKEPNDIEQTEYVKKHCIFDENTIVVGHSFGCVVAMRLLEQGIKIKQAILAGAPLSGEFLDGKSRPSVSEALSKGFDLKKIRKQAESFILLSDINDYVIPLSDGETFSKELSGAWIKTEGAKPHFTGDEEPAILQACSPKIKVFTTRPDTIFGATYMVLAPEHPLIKNQESRIKNYDEIKKYIDQAAKKSEKERTAEGKEKTGVELKGLKAINPATKKEIPVWVADYVLSGVGTGAIMAVPAHDERDFEFAKKFNLFIKRVVQPNVVGPVVAISPSPKFDLTQALSEKQKKLEELEEIYSGVDGKLIDSGKFTDMYCTDAIPKMAEEFGKKAVNYKLRDWVFSRQRYWGEPIPVLHCEDCGIVPVPEKDLPVRLPNVKKYEPAGTGESPLAAMKSWVKTKCPKCKKLAYRETNTMPQWAGSSWYWLRYVDPTNKKEFASIKKQKYWTPVDVYFGGMEHTTLHLLYSRFWNLFLHDEHRVSEKEPYTKRVPHGIVLASDGEKMSKSRGNVVNPDDVVKEYGVDTLRMYEMFLGPYEAMVAWNDQGIVGVKRFLDRVYDWVNNQVRNLTRPSVTLSDIGEGRGEVKDNKKSERLLHRLTKKITEDIENFRFNTAISAFMEFHNEVKDEKVNLESIKKFLVLLYPFAPHITEELNQILDGKTSLQHEKWPEYDPALIVDETVEIVVQINGKVKGKIQIPSGSGEDAAKQEALKLESVKKALIGDSVKRVIFVKDRLINLVI